MTRVPANPNDWNKKVFPWATLSLITLNILVALFTIPYNDVSGSKTLTEMFGFTPNHPSPTNAISSMFLHADVFHLFTNMVFLWIFACQVEGAIGPVPMLLLYFSGGLASVGMHWFAAGRMGAGIVSQPLVGASGAISAVIGYFALRFYRSGVRMSVGTQKRQSPVWIPVWIAALAWLGLQGAGALSSLFDTKQIAIGYWAHIGGFAFGIIVGAVWRAGSVSDKEHAVEHAEDALRLSNPATALNYLRPALYDDPNDPEILFLTGSAWEQLGDTGLMATDWSKAIKSALETGKYGLAKEIAESLQKHHLLKVVPSQRLYELGTACFDNNWTNTAIMILETIVSMPPTAPERENAVLKLADYYLRNTTASDAARRLLEQFLVDYPHSVYIDTARSWLKRIVN